MATERFDIALAGTDIHFSWEGESTLLAAGLAAGLSLPHECASGSCGTCKARLIDGEVGSIWPDAPALTERDRRNGDRILMCQAFPHSNCTVRAPLIEAAEATPPVRRMQATVRALEVLNDSTVRLELDVGAPFDYLAGQFVLIEFADGVRRAYSMSRPPTGSTTLECAIRAKPGGAATQWLFGGLCCGDAVTVEGPYGRAFLQSETDRPIVALAGGSGLGPMLAIVEHAQGAAASRPISLYFGNRRTCDVFFADRIHALRKSGVDTHIVVEQSAPDNCRAGLITDAVIADRADLSHADLYMAGPPGMIDACLAGLVRTGIAPADRVFFDRFE